jgi:hypothetical protein
MADTYNIPYPLTLVSVAGSGHRTGNIALSPENAELRGLAIALLKAAFDNALDEPRVFKLGECESGSIIRDVTAFTGITNR